MSHTWASLAHHLCHLNSHHQVCLSCDDSSKRWTVSRQGVDSVVEARSRLSPLRKTWANNARTHCHHFNQLVQGVVSFSVEPSNQRNLCQRENGSTRRFARKSWPLVNMMETVYVGDSLIASCFLQRETFSETKKKKKKNSASFNQNVQEVDAKQKIKKSNFITCASDHWQPNLVFGRRVVLWLRR